MASLVPCPECHRHVATHERACPFCATDLPDAPAPQPRARLEGLGRAAIFALGATLAAGCSSSPAPAYGTPPADGGSDGGPAMVDDGGPGGFDAAYGAPPPPDGG